MGGAVLAGLGLLLFFGVVMPLLLAAFLLVLFLGLHALRREARHHQSPEWIDLAHYPFYRLFARDRLPGPLIVPSCLWAKDRRFLGHIDRADADWASNRRFPF